MESKPVCALCGVDKRVAVLAVSAVAGTLIDSVKAEIRFMEASGELAASEFFDEPNGDGQRASRMLR